MKIAAGRRAARTQWLALTDTMSAESSAYGEAVRAVRAGELDADEAAELLIDLMTDGEILGLLDGDSPGLLLPLIPILLNRVPFVAGRSRGWAYRASVSATVVAAS
ncbi:beta-Glucosidase [Arthrobacter sp. Hiyo8]|nr:beta-Glucosidase [Arthrobacter sp. Hiyo8]